MNNRIPKNSILTLNPYKYYGTWVFDDAATGLVREAFVQGIPQILEKALLDAGIRWRRLRRVAVLFSARTASPMRKLF